MTPAPIKTVVLLSGGLDSLLTLAELVAKPLHEVERVFALIFTYGQSSNTEIYKAREVCEAWGVPYEIMPISMRGQDTNKEIPARNLIFVSYAASVAMNLGFNTVAIGAEPDSTYTDSSPRFLEEANNLLSLFDLQLLAPVKTLQNKKALVLRALELGVPLHLCHSSRSNKVDGQCKTSSLFLRSLGQVFHNGFLTPSEILEQLSGMKYKFDLDKKEFSIRYFKNNSFKYPAALFSVLTRPEFLQKQTIPVFSTGSWMEDLAAVMALPQISKHCKTKLVLTKTTDLNKMLGQTLNCDSSQAARWGVKQALSLLRRPRYAKHVSCMQTQGHLAETLESMGYVVERPASGTGILIHTAH